ncbi:hypothetical protein MASR1M90_00380 [Desulfovibrionales bacterium]
MFDLSSFDTGFEIHMNTDLFHIDRCIEEMNYFLHAQDLCQHFFVLSLLAREALNNAMIHGNKMDPIKQVMFRLAQNEQNFSLEITDQGPGFAWENHVHAQSDIGCESGRGHEIFTNYATSFSYNDAGNQLTLTYANTQT